MKLRMSVLALVMSFVSLMGCSGGSGDNPLTYTVTYNGNGNISGSVPTDAAGYQAGQTVTVLGNTGSLLKTGLSFNGWNTAADGSGTVYAQAQTFAMGPANLTLYAKWTANPTYTVTYDGNGSTSGSAPADTTQYESAQTITVLGNTGDLLKTGASFNGWNTAADGSGTPYTQAQTFAMGATNVTLYAKWTANPTYTVTYDGNGNTSGSAPADTTHYEAAQTVTVLGNTGDLIKAGNNFVGWNTAADGSGATYTRTQTFAMGNANATLYAKWVLPSALWARTVSQGNMSSTFQSVATDASGNIYAAGSVDRNGPYSFGVGADITGIYGFGPNVALVKYDASGTAQWASTDTAGLDFSVFKSVAADTLGNVYAAGIINHDQLFTFAPGITAQGPYNLATNALLVKYDASSGTALWATSVVDGLKDSWFNAVTTDQAGNVYAAGFIDGNNDYDFGNSVIARGTSAGYNVILVKYDASGTAQWAKTVTAADNISFFTAVDCDAAGNIYAAGYIEGDHVYSFHEGVSTQGTFNVGDNAVLVKYNSDGNAQWARSVTEGPENSTFINVTADATGNIYAVADLMGTHQYSFREGVIVQAPFLGNNATLVKYDASGNALWAKGVSAGVNNSRFNAVTTDSSGDVLVAGYIDGILPFDFGNGVGAQGDYAIGNNSLVVKYSDSGIAQWAKAVVVGPSDSYLYAIALDATNDIYVAGAVYSDEEYTFDVGVSAQGTAHNNSNVLLIKYR